MLRHAIGALFARGWSEAAVGDAVDAFRRSATADPDFALAHAYKSLLLALGAKMGLVQGEALLDEARRDAEMALSLQPRNSEVLGYAGCALADLGDPATGRAAAGACGRGKPRQPPGLGRARARAG